MRKPKPFTCPYCGAAYVQRKAKPLRCPRCSHRLKDAAAQ